MSRALILALMLAGCASQEVPPVEVIQEVEEKPTTRCPELPPLSPTATDAQRKVHHLTVIEMYVKCAEGNP